MIKNLLTSAMADCVGSLKSESDVKDFANQAKEVLALINNGEFEKMNSPDLKKHFLGALDTYIEDKLLPFLDKNGDDFFSKKEVSRKSFLKKEFGNTYTDKYFISLLSYASMEETNELISQFYSSILSDFNKIGVVSARYLDTKTKKDIRKKEFSKGKNFVNFRTNTGILGGIQIFSQGKLYDYSWLGKINSLKTI